MLANRVLKTRFLGGNQVCKSRVPALKNQRPYSLLSSSFFLLLLQLKNHDLSTGIGVALGIKKRKRKQKGELEKKRESKDRPNSPLKWGQVGMGLLFFSAGMNSICWVLVYRFRLGWVVTRFLVLGLWVLIAISWWHVCWVWVWVCRVPIGFDQYEVLGLGLWGRFWSERS